MASSRVAIVVCLFAGEKFGIPHSTGIYDATWVDKLYNMVNRHTTIPFELICLVDDTYPIQAPVTQIPFKEKLGADAGWALMLEAYRPDLTNGYRLTLGLDTIICGNIDCYLTLSEKFAMVSDGYSHEPWVTRYPNYKNEVNNALTWCSPESAKLIWDTWNNERDWVLKNCKLAPFDTVSEMVLLRKLFNKNGDVPRMDDIHAGIYSYKCHLLENKKPLSHSVPKIVYFHGSPKMSDLHPNIYKSNKHNRIVEDWLVKHWI